MANRRFIDFPIAASVGNNDIVLIWQDGLNKQTTKATLLQGSPQSLAGLTDVDISALTNGQILQYNSTTSKWENVDRTDINLSELGDVTIVAPANGQVLVYNSSTGKWENSSGGYVPYTGAVTTVNLGAQTIQAGSFVKAGGTSAQFLKANGSVDSTAYGTGTVTSVALTMPSAFSVGGSPITTAGTLAVTGAGTVGQYIRGDGSLADFPATTGGGSSVSYYLNGSVSQGTIGGVAYKELNKTPIFGAGTDISINADGYIASFITDAGDPNKLLIPAGNWNLETYFSASSNGGTPSFYVELYKYNGTTFTLIATSSAAPELIAFGTNLNPYFSTLAVPETVLALTDRLALRYYVTHSGRTITLHTENNHLCQVITTFTSGLTALNGLTSQVQYLTVGTSGTDFAISSATDTHTFNLPTASATNRGALSSADWTTFNGKQNALTNPVTGTGTTNYLPKFTGASTIGNSQIFDNGTGVGIATTNPVLTNFGVEFTVSGVLKTAEPEGIINIQGNRTSDANIGGLNFFNSTNYIAAVKAVRSGANNSGALSFETVNAGSAQEKMRITSGGNVGIGTQTPDTYSFGGNRTFLTISNTSTSGEGLLQIISSSGGNGNIDFGSSSVLRSRIIGYNNSNLGFFTNSTNSGTGASIKMLITSGGNVLIGTETDAGFKLDVNGTGRFSGNLDARGDVTIGARTADTDSKLEFANGTDAQVRIIAQDFTTDGRLGFWLNKSGVGFVERMVIERNSGNVGIGTASPSSFAGYLNTTLQATGASGVNLDFKTSGGTREGVLLLASGSEFALIAATAIPLTFRTTDTERMRITSGGNVLIGTTTDNGARLQVNGGITVAGTSALADNELRIRSIGDANHAIVNNATINGPLSYGYLGSGLGWTEGSSAQIALMNVREKILIGTTSGGSSKLRIVGLPTSSSGLSSGDVWSDSGTLKIA
jgi:hypothetical protein